MIQKVEQTDGRLAVSYAPELQTNKFFPSMVCGTGQVKILQKYDTGESDILVFGKERVKFLRYVQEIPYLIGEGQLLELNRDMPAQTKKKLIEDIKEMLINWIFTNFEESAKPIQFFKNTFDLEAVCNFVGYYFIGDMEKKQKLLEENNLENKAQAVWQVLKDIEASGGPGPINTPLIFPKGDGNGNGNNDSLN